MNIEHIGSQPLNGLAVVKAFLQPTADINVAISEVIAEGRRNFRMKLFETDLSLGVCNSD